VWDAVSNNVPHTKFVAKRTIDFKGVCVSQLSLRIREVKYTHNDLSVSLFKMVDLIQFKTLFIGEKIVV